MTDFIHLAVHVYCVAVPLVLVIMLLIRRAR